MSSSVTLSAGVRQNLLSLQQTTQLQSQTQQRLATGKKVNSALDNPTNYFTAASLSARAGELTNLLDSMTNGVNTLKAADNGLTSITTTIQSMQATVTQARQDASWQSSSYTLDTTISTTASKFISFQGGAVGGTAISVALNDQETITGGFTAATSKATQAGNLTIQAADINGGVAVTVAVTTNDTGSTIAANINTAVGYTLAAASGTGKITLTDAGPNTITLGDSTGGTTLTGAGFSSTATTSAVGPGAVETVDQIAAAINANTSLSGKVKASNNAGQLQITNLSISSLTVTGINSSGGKLDGSAGTSTIGGNTTRANLVTQFNQLKDQLDKTAQDSSFNGINLLTGDQLKLFFNENSTSSLTIQSTNTAGVNSSTLSISTATNTEFQSNTSLDSRLQTLQTAVTTVASQASAFGNNLSIVQNRQDFTNNMVNTLQTGADGLTLADTNLEGANMLALQTRQQLSIQALSLASQANQAVLRLFG
ncbi:MAG TPA: flagellin [Xanthobacteraceae bacterium]|jgi:flagellin|nr:flagellin [Xanthobacteraceae bacterium]